MVKPIVNVKSIIKSIQKPKLIQVVIPTPIQTPQISSSDSEMSEYLSPIQTFIASPSVKVIEYPIETLSDILDGFTSESSQRESLDEIEVYELNDRELSSEFSYDEDEEIERTMDRQVCIYKDLSSDSEREFSESDKEIENLGKDATLDELLLALAESEDLLSPVVSTDTDTKSEDKRFIDIKKTHLAKDGKIITTIKSVQVQVQQKKKKEKFEKEKVSCLVQNYFASHYQMNQYGFHSFQDIKKEVIKVKRRRIIENVNCDEFLDLGSDDAGECGWYEEKSKSKYRKYGFQQKTLN